MACPKEPCCGGLTSKGEPTEEAHQLTEQVKSEVEGQSGKKFEVFKAVEHRTQLVNGINHFIKVHVGGEDYIHLRVHKAFSGEVSLTAFQEGKTKDSPLEHFEAKH